MEIEIENYRGYEIRFNTDRETFVCDIDDERSVKKSFSAIKKFIDDFIKENNTFKEFKIIRAIDGSWGKYGIITIIGIRKDGRLIGQQGEDKFQMSDYDLSYYVLYDPKNDSIRDDLKKLDDEFEDFRKEYISKKKYLQSKVNEVSLKDYKQQLIK